MSARRNLVATSLGDGGHIAMSEGPSLPPLFHGYLRDAATELDAALARETARGTRLRDLGVTVTLLECCGGGNTCACTPQLALDVWRFDGLLAAVQERRISALMLAERSAERLTMLVVHPCGIALLSYTPSERLFRGRTLFVLPGADPGALGVDLSDGVAP